MFNYHLLNRCVTKSSPSKFPFYSVSNSFAPVHVRAAAVLDPGQTCHWLSQKNKKLYIVYVNYCLLLLNTRIPFFFFKHCMVLNLRSTTVVPGCVLLLITVSLPLCQFKPTDASHLREGDALERIRFFSLL